MNKDYSKQPRKMAQVETIRAGNLVSENPKPKFIEIDNNGKEIERKKHQPRRALEFNNADFFYLCDAAKYLCTHYKHALYMGDKLYVRADLTREIFLDLTIGNYKEQYQNLMDELNYVGNRRCYIPNNKGGYFIMTPFTIAFESTSINRLSADDRRRLKNIGQNNSAKKIDTVYFYFAKPIFEDFLTDRDKQYFRHPKNLYAAIRHCINNQDEETKKTIGKHLNHHVSNFIRWIDYLYLKHAAGCKSTKEIKLDLMEACSTISPEFIKRNEQGQIRMRNLEEPAEFYKAATYLCNQLSGLDFKITKIGFGNKYDNNITLKLEH